MRKQPKSLRPMMTAPRDGTPIDLWSPNCGWVKDIWWDKDVIDDDDYPEAEDGWVTLGPRPFVGWRPIKGMRL